MAKLSIKKIITNMITSKIESMAWDNAHKIANVDNIVLTSETDIIRFEASITVNYHDYTINGAIDENGETWISIITLKRMRCTEKDESGEWITESAKPYTKLIYGESITKFQFDE